MLSHDVRAAIDRQRPMLLVLYLALGGTACVVSASSFMGLSFSPLACAVSLGTIFGIYMLNRYTDMREDFANDSYRAVFFSQRQGIRQLVWVVLASVVALLLLSGKLSAYFLTLIALGMVYSYKLVPWYTRRCGLTFIRLKEVPFMKNLLVSVLWGASVFAVPLLFAGGSKLGPRLPEVAVLAAAIMLSTLLNTLFADILDVEGDRFSDNRTVPVRFGVRMTVAAMVVLDGLWVLMLSVLAARHILDGRMLGVTVALACYPAVYLVTYWQRWLSRTVLEFVNESDLVVFAVGLAVLAF